MSIHGGPRQASYPWTVAISRLLHVFSSLSVSLPSALAVITSPPLANITIDEREDVQLVCVATGSSLEPHPLVVTWSRVDDSLPANSEVLTSKMEREEEVRRGCE